jgi:rubredoxin-like zinc ribbon protein
MSEFAIPACANCGHAIYPPRLACPVCGAVEWEEVPAPTGTLLDVTGAPGYDGTPIRLGTVRLAVLYGAEGAKRNSWPEGEGPPVIAGVDPDVQAGDAVDLELVEGALRARAQRGEK